MNKNDTPTRIEITESMVEQAYELAHGSHGDTDNGRDKLDAVMNKAVGNLAEDVFKRYLQQEYPDADWEHNEDHAEDGTHEYDFLFEGAKVDVKARENDKREHLPCDLLVRHRQNYGGFIYPHIFVQVRIHRERIDSGKRITHAYVTGFATASDVAAAEFFTYKSSRHFKTKVLKENLAPMEDLPTLARNAVRQRRIRGKPVNIKDRILANQDEINITPSYLEKQYQQNLYELGLVDSPPQSENAQPAD